MTIAARRSVPTMAVSVLLLLAYRPQTAHAAPECRILPGFDPPLIIEPLRHGKSRGLAEFRLHIECDAGADGTWALAFNQATGDRAHPLRPINRRDRAQSLRKSRRKHTLKIYDKALYCRRAPDRPAAARQHRVTGPDGHRLTTYETEVRVRLQGTGALAGLSREYTAKVRCPACNLRSRRGSIYVRIPQGRLTASRPPHLEVRLDPAWFDCVRATSTLQLRLFSGPSRAQALNAIRPYAVIEGLERGLQPQGRNKAVKVPLDAATVCRRTDDWVAYELWGDGELHRAGGGGRGAVRVDCAAL